MKNLITLVLSAFLACSAAGQSTLPNGGFENWTYNSTHGFWEPDGGFFKTLNILDTIPLTPPGVSAYKTDSAFSGDLAVRLITREITALDVLIPGVAGTLTIIWDNQTAALGYPYAWSTKPSRFQGYYMSFPLNGDSTGAILLLSKWNDVTKQRDTLAYNKLIFHGTVDTYTKFDEAVNYWDNTEMPDSITVLLLSCGGYNAKYMMGSVGQVGSQACFDEVTLTDISGFEYLLMPEVDVKLAPNPASETITVTLSKRMTHGQFEVYSADGRRVSNFILKETTTILPVGDLTSGLYYYKLTDGNRPVNSGSFIVKK